MEKLTGRERVYRVLHRQPVDRIPAYEHFWSETYPKWQVGEENGGLPKDISFDEYFDFDLIEQWSFNVTADLDFEDEILEETDETVLYKNGNGSSLRYHKKHSSTPEHVDFTVVDGETWKPYREKLINTPVERRINYDEIARMMEYAKRKDKYSCIASLNVFECLHPIMGHENMLANLIEEPDTMKDMISVYTDLLCKMFVAVFERLGTTDGVYFYEDMGFKEHPFISPAMYDEFFLPAHKKLIGLVKSYGCDVIMHSCGFIEPLIPGMIEAGIDCLQAMEVKAGMDLPRIKKNFGDRIVLMGGLDVRELESNDLERVDAELERKIPIAMKDSGFILHTDHSIPPTVEPKTYKHFLKKGLELGTY